MKKQQNNALWGRIGLTGLLLASSAAYADISGKVFRDFNGNGVFDSGAGFNEVGAAAVTVKAFDSSGVEKATTTSGADGTYTLSGLAPGADYRIEFSWAESWLKPGAAGGTSVQFAQDGAMNINLALQGIGEYSSPVDPYLIIPTYRNGTGIDSTDAAIHTFPRSNSGLNQEYTAADGTQGTGSIPNIDVTLGEIGSTWGIAWQADKKRAYAASFLKRHAGIRKGLGYVYVIDQKTQPGKLIGEFDLQGVIPANGGTPIDLGNVCRDATCATEAGRTGNPNDYVLPEDKYTPNVDMDAFYKVGKVGFGDADMQPNSNLLWLVNANQRALITVDVGSDNVNSLPGTVKQYVLDAIPGMVGCQGGSARPWALAFAYGKGYLGVTCDAFNSRQANDLKASILEFSPENVEAGFNKILEFPLAYSRDSGALFQPWLNETEANSGYLSNASGQVNIPQPLLSDMVFDEFGNLYLNIMDIFTHQTGNYNYKPYPGGSTQVINGIANGDFIKACKTTNGFVLEGHTDCPVNFPNGAGPHSVGEFFEDNAGDGRAESANGAMAILHGSGQIDAVLMDPHPTGQVGQRWWTSQGVNTYSLTDGKITNWYSVHHASDPSLFGKGSGLGDIELMTDPAPIEIGNRVWRDANGNGIQDAGEAGIDGVEVALTCGSDTATVSTSNGGQFLFSTKAGGNAAFMNYGEACELTIADSQSALSGLQLATPNTDGKTDNDAVQDVRDSDAAAESGKAVIRFKSGNMGENNHGLDVGYRTPATYSLGNRVWIDVNNNGKADSGEDPAGAGIKLELRDKDGNKLADTLTDANGRYLFHGLAAGQYQVCVTADNFAAGSQLAKHRSSTGQADADSTSEDGVDRGDDDVTDGACSTVTVLNDQEPTKEYGFSDQQDGNDGQGTPDANSNLTLDFGFVPPTDIELTKTVDKTSIKPGETVTYTLTATNKSPVTATGVKVSEQLPPRATLVNAAASQGTFAGSEWDIGTLPANGSATLNLEVKVE